MKFRFARKGKTKPPPPPPEGEEQGEETGEGEGNGETLERLVESASALVQPTETQEPLPPPPQPESVPPRLHLAQVQATAESHPVAQTPPPTRRPPQVVARRTTQTARHDLPLKARNPVYSRAICIITKNVNGIRVVLKSLPVSTTQDFFRVRNHTFYVDISQAFMVSAKGPYLMYDIDVTEPLDKNAVSGEVVEHPPILIGDNVHYSQHVNLLLQGKVIEQALKSVSQEQGWNIITWVMLGIGVMLGLFAGLYLAPVLHIGTVTTTTTTTTTAATMSPLWRLLRL